MAGTVLLAAGGILLGTAVAASAASPTISFTPTTPLGPTDQPIVTVKGSGFKAKSIGALFECSNVASQPTIDVMVFSGSTSVDVGQIPVSCSTPSTVTTNAAGAIPKATQIGLVSGVLGPPATGKDSAGTDAQNDAHAYPCPPTTAQTSAACELLYVDAAGDKASAPISFTFQTSTTTPPTTTPSSCTGVPGTATAPNNTVNPPTNPSVTVNPATCLTAGETVTVTGTGLQPGAIGSILECNASGSNATYNGTAGATLSSIASGSLVTKNLVGKPDTSGTLSVVASGGNGVFSFTGVTVSGTDATFTGLTLTGGTGTWTVAANAIVTEGQPTITYLGNAIPVSCSKVVTFQTTSDGGVPTGNQSFEVNSGTVGPPQTGTDSNGNDAAADAAKYPCPPTADQVAAGKTCVIAVGDVAGDKVPVPISFNGNGGPPVTTTTAGGGGGGGGGTETTAVVTAASSSGTLAATGSGPVLWMVGAVGLMLILLGGSLLVLCDAPRRLVLAATRVSGRLRGSR